MVKTARYVCSVLDLKSQLQKCFDSAHWRLHVRWPLMVALMTALTQKDDCLDTVCRAEAGPVKTDNSHRPA